MRIAHVKNTMLEPKMKKVKKKSIRHRLHKIRMFFHCIGDKIKGVFHK